MVSFRCLFAKPPEAVYRLILVVERHWHQLEEFHLLRALSCHQVSSPERQEASMAERSAPEWEVQAASTAEDSVEVAAVVVAAVVAPAVHQLATAAEAAR